MFAGKEIFWAYSDSFQPEQIGRYHFGIEKNKNRKKNDNKTD